MKFELFSNDNKKRLQVILLLFIFSISLKCEVFLLWDLGL